MTEHNYSHHIFTNHQMRLYFPKPFPKYIIFKCLFFFIIQEQQPQLSGWLQKCKGMKGKGKKHFFILRYGFIYYGDKDNARPSEMKNDSGEIDFPDRNLSSFHWLNLRTALDIENADDTLTFSIKFPLETIYIKVSFITDQFIYLFIFFELFYAFYKDSMLFCR